MKLHALTISSRCSAAAMGLDLAGIDYELKFWGFPELQTELVKVNPNGKVPTLETPEGAIFETHAILRYAARSSGKLYGANNYENTLVDQWLDWVNCELQTLAPLFLYQTFGFEMPGLTYQKDVLYKSKATFTKKLAIVNKALEGKDWLVGNEITIADVALLNCIIQFISFMLGDKQRKGFANIMRWLDNCAETDAFKKWWGRLRLIPSALNFPRVETGPAKPKAQPKKKAKKAPVQQQKKKKGPSFPPTDFNLMSFKTFFINEADKEAAMAKFWNDYDANGWSLWHLEYIPYKKECEVLFKLNNLMGGFLRGFQPFQKYIFGTHAIFGDEPNLFIEGVWMIQGTEIIPEISESGVFETYKWNKLDQNNEEHKALVTKFWTQIREEDVDTYKDAKLRTFKWVK